MDEFVLTAENYYSPEANERYLSVHQFLAFAGGMLHDGCEERALKEMKAEWQEPPSKALLVGSYVDSFFEGSLETFKQEHKEIFTQKGELKAEYKQAEKMIARCLEDEYFMKFMSGEKQVIMTGEWAGAEWKIKMDSYIPETAIVDLKTTASLHKAWRINDYGYASFVEAYNYDKQLALYQKIVEIKTGYKLPCYIAAVTKEEYPEIAIIHIDQFTLDNALNQMRMDVESVLAVKNEEVEPTRCGHCNYCKTTAKLMKPINYRDLIMESE